MALVQMAESLGSRSVGAFVALVSVWNFLGRMGSGFASLNLPFSHLQTPRCTWTCGCVHVHEDQVVLWECQLYLWLFTHFDLWVHATDMYRSTIWSSMPLQDPCSFYLFKWSWQLLIFCLLRQVIFGYKRESLYIAFHMMSSGLFS